jgi:site-specific DNA recombinase
MEPNLFKKFCEEFTREVKRARIERIERSASIVGHRKELEKVERDLDRAIQAIPDGVPGAQVKDRIGAP